MLKKIFVVLGLLSTVCLFAEEAIKWDWNLDTEAKLKSCEVPNDYVKDIIIPIQLALVGKDSKNITYNQFKSVINDVITSQNISSDLKKYTIIRIAFKVKRFNSFLNNAMEDSEINDSIYIIKDIALSYFNTPESFRKYYFVEKNITKIPDGNDYYLILYDIFSKYKKYSLNYKSDEVKEDLKILKRLVYPNIDKGENWKQLAVKIELLLKSVE